MVSIPINPEIRILYKKDMSKEVFARIEVGKLLKGFGITIGNSLRRIMLSYMEGIAPVSMTMRVGKELVLHEFDIKEGLYEDVLQIVQNIKMLKLKGNVEECKVLLETNKEGEYYAKDLSLPAGVELINPELKLFTLTKNIKVRLEIYCKKDRGYVPAEEHKDIYEEEVGTIFIDSIFTPVIKVNIDVDHDLGVGGKFEFDKLIMEILTDGRDNPVDVFNKALHWVNVYSNILLEGMAEAKLSQPKVEVVVDKEPKVETKNEEEVEEKVLEIPIAELDLEQRIKNALLKADDIKTLGDLVKKSDHELLKLKNFGESSLKKLEKYLKEKFNLSLQGNE